jgi:pyruvate dehydrogenase E2 component (dihydrolipoamide acetyltransferase)
MATEIKMPQLSDTMSSGKILVWRKKEGETVNRGDILAEVETDKANLEIESFGAGVLLKIATPEGSTAKVGEAIAFIGQAGEKLEGASTAAPAPAAPKAASISAAPVSAAPAQHLSIAQSSSHATPSQVMSAHAPSQDASGRIKASPLARKIARDQNIDLTLVSGTGPAGRIIRRDIEAAMVEKSSPSMQRSSAPLMTHGSAAVAAPISMPTPAPMQARSEGTTIAGGKLTPLSKMRETIARRMQESVTQQPHFYVTCSINMMEAKKLREALKEAPGYQGVSYNHLIIKATAYALSKEPRVNRAMKDGMQYDPENINVGIITAIEDGLIIPVLHSADKMSLKDVVFEARAAVDRARAGRPTAQDLSGGTFSISNMGMFDVDSFTAIINPGQGGVLAVSAIKEEPVVYQGAVVPGLTMKATISVDHRVIDGVMAGNFLKHFKQALEVPALLMM